MPSISTGKICGLCGSDCSNRSRIKDKKGKYYCKICYDRAMARQHAAEMVDVDAAIRSPGTEVALIESEDDFSALNALLESQALAGGAAPAPTAVRQCANCHAPLSSIAVVCVNCGYNVQTGKQTSATVLKATGNANFVSGRSIWPIVIGIISIALGGPTMAIYAINFISRILAPNFSDVDLARRVGELAGISLGFSICAWLTIAGLGVVRRRQSAFRMLRRWSTFAIIFIVIIAVITFLAINAVVSNTRLTRGLDARANVAYGLIVVLILLSLAWPVFLSVWCRRPKICREVQEWD